jgi:hypothetical protein
LITAAANLGAKRDFAGIACSFGGTFDGEFLLKA